MWQNPNRIPAAQGPIVVVSPYVDGWPDVAKQNIASRVSLRPSRVRRVRRFKSCRGHTVDLQNRSVIGRLLRVEARFAFGVRLFGCGPSFAGPRPFIWRFLRVRDGRRVTAR